MRKGELASDEGFAAAGSTSAAGRSPPVLTADHQKFFREQHYIRQWG